LSSMTKKSKVRLVALHYWLASRKKMMDSSTFFLIINKHNANIMQL
jgi:hypothetical protein